jgi:hypothetical protein
MFIVSDSWDGKRRKLSSHFCLQCGKEFFAPLKAKAKYCNKACFYLKPKRTIDLVCSFCNKAFVRKPSYLINGKHKVYFCSRPCKDKGQSIAYGNKEIWPSHYGSDSGYRNKISVHTCIGCGETRKFLLFVHHIDGDREHNVAENLECVCPTCHVIRHLHLVKGMWSYCTKVLTPREYIKEITGKSPNVMAPLLQRDTIVG